jgi:hypothetical protein
MTRKPTTPGSGGRGRSSELVPFHDDQLFRAFAAAQVGNILGCPVRQVKGLASRVLRLHDCKLDGIGARDQIGPRAVSDFDPLLTLGA